MRMRERSLRATGSDGSRLDPRHRTAPDEAPSPLASPPVPSARGGGEFDPVPRSCWSGTRGRSRALTQRVRDARPQGRDTRSRMREQEGTGATLRCAPGARRTWAQLIVPWCARSPTRSAAGARHAQPRSFDPLRLRIPRNPHLLLVLVGRRRDEYLEADLLQDVLVDEPPLLRRGQLGAPHGAAAGGGDAPQPPDDELSGLSGSSVGSLIRSMSTASGRRCSSSEVSASSACSWWRGAVQQRAPGSRSAPPPRARGAPGARRVAMASACGTCALAVMAMISSNPCDAHTASSSLSARCSVLARRAAVPAYASSPGRFTP